MQADSSLVCSTQWKWLTLLLQYLSSYPYIHMFMYISIQIELIQYEIEYIYIHNTSYCVTVLNYIVCTCHR